VWNCQDERTTQMFKFIGDKIPRVIWFSDTSLTITVEPGSFILRYPEGTRFKFRHITAHSEVLNDSSVSSGELRTVP
jgi:hypothetical protein